MTPPDAHHAIHEILLANTQPTTETYENLSQVSLANSLPNFTTLDSIPYPVPELGSYYKLHQPAGYQGGSEDSEPWFSENQILNSNIYTYLYPWS